MRRRERLDTFLDRTGLDAVWFARPNNFAWLTGGSNVVDEASSVGVAAAGYTGDGLRVLTNDIEAERLVTEELPDEALVDSYPWHETDLADALAERSPAPAAADFEVPGFEHVDASSLRQPLTEADVTRYRELGRDTAAAVETVCRDVEPDTTEREAAAALRTELAARDVRASVVLVGSETRAPKYRHYTPRSVDLGGYALLSVTATRDGLSASLTRAVRFDAPAWYEERRTAAARIATTALAATRCVGASGGSANQVFEHVQDAYAATGYAEEWRNHHQGGAAGFAGREWIATPDSAARVHLPMGYAWNPTVRGTKIEDTWLVTEEGFECLTTGDAKREPADAVGFDVSLEHAVAFDG